MAATNCLSPTMKLAGARTPAANFLMGKEDPHGHVGWPLPIHLAGVDVGKVGRPAINGHAYLVQIGGRAAAGEIGIVPAPGCSSEIASVDLNERAGGGARIPSESARRLHSPGRDRRWVANLSDANHSHQIRFHDGPALVVDHRNRIERRG